MTRIVGWLALVSLALAAHFLDSPLLRAACVPAIVLLFALSGPPALRVGLFVLAALLVALIAAGYATVALDLTPALIAGLVGWLFARTLLRGRLPLIARAIVAIDGPAQLDDPAVARYARRLTLVWAVYQAMLALAALLLALRSAWFAEVLPMLPGPRVFGVFVLPLAVLALALGEFVARARLLPQAPRHSLPRFLHALVRAWPAILNE